jgi:mRNA-degrading endonuclease toxin of MazEF toxin-antitoxin module
MAGSRADTRVSVVLDAANQVVTTGKVVADQVTSLGWKAIACAGKAVQVDADASASLNVSVMASANLSGSCGGPSGS